nr:hypothetical protein [Methylosinus trichosporium]
MRAGEALEPSPSLEQIRTHAREAIATLPAGCRALSPSSYPVTISGALARYEREVMSKIAASSQPIAAMRVAASCR